MAQLKKNQQELYERIATLTQTTKPADLFESHDLVRSRLEDRRTEVFDLRETVAETEWAAYLVQAIQVRRHTLERIAKTGLWKPRSEVAFYVSSIELSAEQAAAAIRGHWGIENRNHYVRDTALSEDQSRIRTNPGIFARLRSIAINILRANNVQNINDALWKNALNLNKTLQLIHCS